MAWLGFMVLAIGLGRTAPGIGSFSGLLLGAIADLWVAHPWQLGSARAYSGGSGWITALIVVGFTAAHVVPKWLPVVVGWKLCRRWPTSLWLPVAWVVGEWLRDRLTHLSYNDWLFTQWQVTPVLRAVGHFGWTPALWLCLLAAAAIGDLWLRRSWQFAQVPAGVAILLLVLPPLPKASPALLASVGAVHMTGFFYPPQGAPPGIQLLIWPEQANYQRPWLGEGPGMGKKIEPPFPPAGVSHLYGLITRQPTGRQNSAMLVAPDGTVVASRAKVRLFPLLERSLFGVWLPGAFHLVAGQASATLPTPVGPVLSLLCLEGLERDYIEAEARSGAVLITLCANERVLVHSRLATTQFAGVAAVLAADTGVPLVRSSLYGTAAIADSDGTLLAESEPETDGVLTVAGDLIRNDRRAKPRN
jgi:apolipoprotein N-acyltransferase